MKHSILILFTLSAILSAGCSGVEYSFRVTESSFVSGGFASPGAPPDPCLPKPCITLDAEGELPGTPAGDSYLTTGVVTASGGEITAFGDGDPTGITLRGHDLNPDDPSPTAVVIQFDSRCVHQSENPQFSCMLGDASSSTTFRVRDEQGVIGVTLQITGFSVSVDGHNIWGGGSGGSFEFNQLHTVTIQMNFENTEGLLTVTQFGQEETEEFELPVAFEIAHSLEMEITSSSPHNYRIITPVANFVSGE